MTKQEIKELAAQMADMEARNAWKTRRLATEGKCERFDRQCEANIEYGFSELFCPLFNGKDGKPAHCIGGACALCVKETPPAIERSNFPRPWQTKPVCALTLMQTESFPAIVENVSRIADALEKLAPQTVADKQPDSKQ